MKNGTAPGQSSDNMNMMLVYKFTIYFFDRILMFSH